MVADNGWPLLSKSHVIFRSLNEVFAAARLGKHLSSMQTRNSKKHQHEHFDHDDIDDSQCLCYSELLIQHLFSTMNDHIYSFQHMMVVEQATHKDLAEVPIISKEFSEVIAAITANAHEMMMVSFIQCDCQWGTVITQF